MKTVRELMNENPCVLGLDATLGAVVDMMTFCGCGQLPVVDADGKLVGIVTRRDVQLAGREATETKVTISVDRFMTHNPVTVKPETPAHQAASLLSAYRFDSLPVVESERLVGIITVGSFLDTFPDGAWRSVF